MNTKTKKHTYLAPYMYSASEGLQLVRDGKVPNAVGLPESDFQLPNGNKNAMRVKLCYMLNGETRLVAGAPWLLISIFSLPR